MMHFVNDLATLGQRMRHFRTSAGLTLDQLGAEVTHSLAQGRKIIHEMHHMESSAVLSPLFARSLGDFACTVEIGHEIQEEL